MTSPRQETQHQSGDSRFCCVTIRQLTISENRSKKRQQCNRAHLKIAHKKSKKSCILFASSLPLGQRCSAARGNSAAWDIFPCWEKKRLKETTGSVTSFSSLSEHCTNDLLCFHPTQRWAEPRHLETTRNKEEGQGLPVSTTKQEWLWFSVPCSAESPRNLAMTKPSASIVTGKPLKILVLITLPGSTLADSNCLSPAFPLNPQKSCSSQWRPETQDPHQLPALIFWAGHVQNPIPDPCSCSGVYTTSVESSTYNVLP